LTLNKLNKRGGIITRFGLDRNKTRQGKMTSLDSRSGNGRLSEQFVLPAIPEELAAEYSLDLRVLEEGDEKQLFKSGSPRVPRRVSSFRYGSPQRSPLRAYEKGNLAELVNWHFDRYPEDLTETRFAPNVKISQQRVC